MSQDAQATVATAHTAAASSGDAALMAPLLDARRRLLAGMQAVPAIQAALAGQLAPQVYVRYLVNAYQYSRHSSKIMALGAVRCLDEHPQLGAYLLHHAEEERGHEQWALADARALGVSAEEMRAAEPVPSCEAMVGYVYYVAQFANPVGLFGWMYVLEALGEDFGTAISERLKAAPALANSVRFVAGHGVSDVGHTHEIAEQITRYVQRDADQRAVQRVGDVVGDLFLRMFQEIGGAPRA